MQNMPRHDPIPPPPDAAAAAWSEYRRLMKWMALASALAALAAVAWLWSVGTEMRLGTILATVAGVGLSVMLGTALMGLVFVSSRGGHDEDAGRAEEPR